PLDKRSQSLQRLIVIARAAFAFLVFPVRSNTFLGDLMHSLGTDLDFERLAVGSDDGRVKRLVEIVARSGNPVLDATWYGFPVVMDHTQRRVTVTHFVRSDDPRGNKVVNLV